MDREEARNLLSEYVLGQLDATRATAVAERLADDAELRRTEGFLRWLAPLLREMKDHLPGVHPTGQELVAAVLAHGSAPDQQGDWVRHHLAECSECRRLADLLEEADAQLAHGENPRPAAPRQWIKLAVAAGIAVVLFSSGIWIGNRPDDGPGLEAGYVHLAGLTRGQSVAAEVSPAADGRTPPLVVDCDPWVGRANADDFLLEVRLVERDTRQVFQTWTLGALAAWSTQRGGLLIPPAPAPVAGDYELEVRDETGAVIFTSGLRLLPR